MTPKRPSTWWRKLHALGACKEAVEWAKTQPSLAVAWRECRRGDWMLWLAGRLAGEPGSDARRPLTLAACACARLILPRFEAAFPANDRPRKAIETAEAWARDEGPTLIDIRRAAASSAASAASASAAYAASAASAAYIAAAAGVVCTYANIVRKHYPTAPKLPVRKKDP